MAMYTQLLALAARESVDVAPGSELVDGARRCRADLIRSGTSRNEISEVLAAELRYDRALLALCASVGIETSVQRFSSPIAERRRLERELVSRGIDLTVLGEPQSQRAPRGSAAGGRPASPGAEQRSDRGEADGHRA